MPAAPPIIDPEYAGQAKYKCLQAGHYPHLTFSDCYDQPMCEYRQDNICNIHDFCGYFKQWNPSTNIIMIECHNGTIRTEHYKKVIAYTCEICHEIPYELIH